MLGERGGYLPIRCRALVVDYIAGSTRVIRNIVFRRMWLIILLGKEPRRPTYAKERRLFPDDEYFAIRIACVDTPLLWKLQFSFHTVDQENLIYSVIRFLI